MRVKEGLPFIRTAVTKEEVVSYSHKMAVLVRQKMPLIHGCAIKERNWLLFAPRWNEWESSRLLFIVVRVREKLPLIPTMVVQVRKKLPLIHGCARKKESAFLFAQRRRFLLFLFLICYLNNCCAKNRWLLFAQSFLCIMEKMHLVHTTDLCIMDKLTLLRITVLYIREKLSLVCTTGFFFFFFFFFA